MSTDLKNQLGLGEPAPAGASDQGDKFKADFQAIIGPINTHLQYTAAHAPQAKHDAMAVKRDTAFKAYQAALAKIDPANPKTAQGAIDQVMKAVKALGPAVATFKQATEKSFTAWESRQGDLNAQADKIREMNEWEYAKAPALQAALDAIKNKANAREYDDASKGLDQLLAKGKPIIEDYEKQRAAQAEYEPGWKSLQPRVDASKTVEFATLAQMRKDLASATEQMTKAASVKDYATALSQLKTLEGNVGAFEGRKAEIEENKRRYDEAVEKLKPRLASSQTSTYQKLVSLQKDLEVVQQEMEKLASAEDFEKAMPLAGNLTVKLDEFERITAEIERQKQAYESKLNGLKSKLAAVSVSDYRKLEPMKNEVATMQSQMEAAAQSGDYDQAGQLADQLGPRLEQLEVARNELETKRKDFEDKKSKLCSRLAAINQTSADSKIGPLQQEMDVAQQQMDASASREDFDEAVALAQTLSTMLDNYEKLEAGQIYLITYDGKEYRGTAEELAVLKAKIAAAVIKDGFPPLKNRAEMNQGWYNELKAVRDEFVIIGAVVNALGGASLESIATALAAQKPALDAASAAIAANIESAEEPYRKAVEAINATGQAITAYLDALETGGNRTITALQVVEVTCFAIGAAAGAAVLAPAGATLAATAGANALSAAGFGALQSLAENGAHNLIMTGEKPISPGEIVTNAAVAAIANGVGAALGTVAGKQLGGMVTQKLVVKFGFQTTVMKLIVQDCVEGALGNTVQTAVAGSPDLVRGKTTWDQFAVAIVQAFIVGGISAAIAGKMNRNSPLFKNLSDEEINAAFREAESGQMFQLPGKNPATGEGLKDVKVKFDPNKPIPHHDNMNFTGIKDAPKGKAEVRRHSANPNAPDGSYSQSNPTTQVNSGKKYMLPDGTWKSIADMTPEERAACHIP